jgi:tetratricopeptide (TPR) repeat protein/tRNA A-37 threonylcarbamoyl transferase component Bud32
VQCPHCGAEVREGAGRCPTCLHSITPPPGAPAAEAATGVFAPAPGATRRPDAAAPATGAGRTPIPAGGGAGPLAPGQTFGPRYHIIKLLGMGGMGAVYQAWDAELGVAVAIKVIRPETMDDPEAARDLEMRFKRELLLARQVTHKNVVRIHDLGEIDGIKYITMPFVNGQDLDSILKQQGRLPVPRALATMKQVVAGLQAAHEAGVVHRDLKPANVMIEDEQVLVMDFGIARSVSGATMATVAGSVVGTFDYMAPEQARAEQVDQRADVYALGLIFYDLILGRRAASAENPMAALMARLQQAPPPPRSIDPQVPEALDAIVTRCVQPDPAARYQTSADLAAALDELDADGHPRRAVVKRRGISLPVAAAGAALVLALVGGTWWLAIFTAGSAVAPAAHEPVSVLIADFDNKTGDQVFQGSLEQALALGMEGASFITSYPRGTALRIVEEIRPGATLNETGAQLVSVREGIKVILAGTIETAGSGYRISVKAVEATIDPASAKPLAEAEANAADKSKVLGAIQEVASDIRGDLGDTTAESARDAGQETFTAASLEAVRAYALAQDLALNGKNEGAIGLYKEAVGQDEKFGRAYAGWAVSAYRLGRRDEAEEMWKKALSLTERMTEREKYRTLGTYYTGVARNYEKAIENYEALVKAYPADGAGLNSLGVAYFSNLNIPKAIEQGKRALEVYPKNPLYRANLALYLMYAGDFTAATAEAKTVLAASGTTHKAYLPLAMASLVGGDLDAARQAYQQMAKTGSLGASLAPMGLADLAMFQGAYAEAEDALRQGIADDQAAKRSDPQAIKQIALAEIAEATGRTSASIRAAREALKIARPDAVVIPAARLFIHAGRMQEAQELAATYGRQLSKQSRAYAKVLEAEMALEDGRTTEAIDALVVAKGLADLWLVRLMLGRAYVEAGLPAEAISELELCQKRRGEATAIFLDDVPSYRYLAPVSYWLARAQEGLGMKDAARANYEAYLSVREGAAGDRLAADARKRLGK